MATPMADKVHSAACGEHDRPRVVNGDNSWRMYTDFRWQASNHATVAMTRRTQTWTPTDGIVFAKKRITTWEPSNGIIFAGQDTPSNTRCNQQAESPGLKKSFTSSACPQSRVPPRASRGSLLPTPRTFNASEQRKPDLPPVEIEDDEDDPDNPTKFEGHASGGQTRKGISRIKDESSSSMVSRLLSLTNTSTLSGLYPKRELSDARKEETPNADLGGHTSRPPPTVKERVRKSEASSVQQARSTPSVKSQQQKDKGFESKKRRTRHTQPLHALEVSSVPQDRNKAPVISDKSPEEQIPTQSVVMLDKANLPALEVPTDESLQAVSPSKEDPIMDLLTVENFMLSKEEIQRWHNEQASMGSHLINALSHRQREILLHIRTQHVSLEDCISMRAEALDEYDKVFAKAKSSTRALTGVSRRISHDLQNLIMVGQHSPNKDDQLYARSVFSIAELRVLLFTSEIPRILHELRYSCRSRFRLYFDFLQLQLRIPETTSRNVLVPTEQSHMTDLQTFRFKITSLIQKTDRDLMYFEEVLAHFNTTIAQNRPMSPSMKNFFLQRKEQLGLITYVLVSIMEDVRTINWHCIFSEPLYLHSLRSLTSRQEAIVLLVDKWSTVCATTRDLLEDLVAVFGPLHYRLGQQATAAEQPSLMSFLRRASFARSSIAAAFRSLIDEMRLVSSIQTQFTYSGLEYDNVRAAVRHKRITSKRQSIAPTSDVRMVNGATSPWSHQLYRDAEGNAVKTYYFTNSYSTRASEVIKQFGNIAVIGLDLEWSPFAKGTDDAYKNVSMVQLATDGFVAVFHVALHPEKIANRRSGTWEPVSHQLRRVLENPRILKVGVNIKSDCTRLRKHFGIYVQGATELSHLHNQLEYHLGRRKTLDRRVIRLSDLVRKYLKMELPKGEVRMRDWSKEIENPEAIHYAAADAYAGLQLFYILDAKRQALNPTPDRPFPTEFEKAIPCVTSLHKDKPAVVTKIEPDEGYARSSLPLSSGIDASLLDSRDNGPIELIGLEVTAWKFVTYMGQNWRKKYGYAVAKRLTSYIAWHMFCLDINAIAREMSWRRSSMIRSVEIEQEILETLRRYTLPFDSRNLSRILLPSLKEAPMPTVEILRLREVLRKQHNLREYSSPSTFPPAGKEQYLAFGLWKDHNLSLAQISLVLLDRPLTVIGWIRDVLGPDQKSSSLKLLERRLFHEVYLMKGVPEGAYAPGVHQDGKPFIIVDHPHILNLKRSSSVDDISEAIRRQRLLPGISPSFENAAATKMYGHDELVDNWNEQKATLRAGEDRLQRELLGWGALAEGILSDDPEMRTPQDGYSPDEDIPNDDADISTRTLQPRPVLSDIEKAWDDYLDTDASEVPWDSLQVFRVRSRSKSPGLRGRRRRPVPIIARRTPSRIIVRRTPSTEHAQ